MSVKAWRQALKFPSLQKLLPPVLLGWAAAWQLQQSFNPILLVLSLLFCWAGQAAIVLLNDYADRDADANHLRLFPGTIDLRVIPSGLLSPGRVLTAGVLASALLVLGGTIGGWYLNRPWFGAFCAAVLILIWAYSFSPFKLNYRGFGELLEAFGVSVILSLGSYYILTGDLTAFPYAILLPVFLFSCGGAVLSGLRHFQADTYNKKNTVIVKYGPTVTGTILKTLVFTVLICITAGFLMGVYRKWAIIIILPGAIYLLSRHWKLFSAAALTDPSQIGMLKKVWQRVSLSIYTGLSISVIFNF